MGTHRQYFAVFGEGGNREIYRLALEQRQHFTASKTSPNKLYPDWRRSTVIYDDRLAGVADRLEREIRSRLPEVVTALAMPPFQVGSLELQLTSHNDGEYYRWHTDNGTRETAARVISFVYYFHAVPRRHNGGELVIDRADGEQVTVDPTNDSLVFFDARTRHEVMPVTCPSRLLEDGRFTLNGWVRRKAATRSEDYFDARIFSLPVRSAQRTSTRSRVADPTPAAGASSALARPSPRAGEIAAVATPDTYTAAASASIAPTLLKLYSELHRQSGTNAEVDVVRRISGPQFYARYYGQNRPVVLKGVMSKSAAVRTWSPRFFRDRFGSVPVQITTGRDADPDYEMHLRRTLRTVTMADFVERLVAEPESNDFYLVARNHFFENPALRALRDDLRAPPTLVDATDQRPGTVKLWFGPRGTVTPLHYDEHSILLAQIYGTKRFKLIPSFDYQKVYPRHRFYSAVDPERVDGTRYPEFLRASVADVTLEPGDMLFIPVAWWHWAKALDVSISATFCSFLVDRSNTSLSSG